MALKKAMFDDVDAIYKLYKKYFGDSININLFKKIYSNYWKSSEGYFGYVLYDNDDAVAFCGYIFYTRFINGREEKFCNFGGWVVEKEYRKEYKTEVLKPLLKLAEQGYTLIGLSPTPAAYRVEKKMGFKDLESGKIKFILNPTKIRLGKTKCIKLCNEYSLTASIFHNEEILKVHKDHLVFEKIKRLLINVSGEEIYLIYMPILRKKIFRIMDILYISNTSLFFRKREMILNSLFCNSGICGFRVESRFVPERMKDKKNFVPFLKPHIYLSKNLDPWEIDVLYTERFLVYCLGEVNAN